MNILMKQFIIVIIFSTTLVFLGCEKKTETPEVKQDSTIQTDPMEVEETMVDTTTPVVEIPVVQIPDLVGKWTGKFDGRVTTLNITEQDGLTYKGSITINYRDVINQQISGKINLEKKTFTMNDLLHHRFAGSYSGKISDDLNTLAGTFIQKVDKRQAQFNLRRK